MQLPLPVILVSTAKPNKHFISKVIFQKNSQNEIAQMTQLRNRLPTYFIPK